ncbi:MAG: hypothetical protein R6U28_07245 [Cyclonatronaceae bacterium]
MVDEIVIFEKSKMEINKMRGWKKTFSIGQRKAAFRGGRPRSLLFGAVSPSGLMADKHIVGRMHRCLRTWSSGRILVQTC